MPLLLWRPHLAAAQGISCQSVGHLHIEVVVCFVDARRRDRLVYCLLICLVFRIFIVLVKILLLILVSLLACRYLNLNSFVHFGHVALLFKKLLLLYQVQVNLRGFSNHQVDACQVVHIQEVESTAQQRIDWIILRV